MRVMSHEEPWLSVQKEVAARPDDLVPALRVRDGLVTETELHGQIDAVRRDDKFTALLGSPVDRDGEIVACLAE